MTGGLAMIADLPGVTASRKSSPPAWARLQRELIALMEESGRLFARRYFERGGGTLLAEDLDDLYEQTYNYGLFYAICSTPSARPRICSTSTSATTTP